MLGSKDRKSETLTLTLTYHFIFSCEFLAPFRSRFLIGKFSQGSGEAREGNDIK